MKTNILFVSLLLIIFVGFSCSKQEPTAPELNQREQGGLLYKTSAGIETQAENADNFVVEFNGSVEQLTAAVEGVGGTVDRAHPEIGVAKVSGIDDSQAKDLKKAQGIKHVTRDLVVQWVPTLDNLSETMEASPGAEPHVDPSLAPFFSFQWNLRAIQADLAWPTGNQGQGTLVAIIDTGIDNTHPEMVGKVAVGLSVAFTPNLSVGPVWGDDNFHGTHVGSIVSSNAFRTASVAPHATLVAVKVLDFTGSGTFADVIAGIIYSTNIGVDVMNMSLGAYFPKNFPGLARLNAAITKAVNFANINGVLVVASAGNDGVNLDADGNFIHTPSQSGSAMSISATGPVNQTNFDQLAFYSNFGHSGADVAAPGGNFGSPFNVFDFVLGPCSTQSLAIPICASGPIFYVFVIGTSQAAPHASGTAAIIDGRSSGALNGGQLHTKILQTADDLGAPGADLIYSHGRINAFNAATQ